MPLQHFLSMLASSNRANRQMPWIEFVSDTLRENGAAGQRTEIQSNVSILATSVIIRQCPQKRAIETRLAKPHCLSCFVVFFAFCDLCDPFVFFKGLSKACWPLISLVFRAQPKSVLPDEPLEAIKEHHSLPLSHLSCCSNTTSELVQVKLAPF